MKVTKVMVNRKFNLGNYETLDMAAEAELNDTDNPLEIWQVLRDNIEMEYIVMQNKTKPTPPQPTPTAQPQEATLNNFIAEFPPEQQQRLDFALKGNKFIIRPKQFLGSDMFAQVSAVVRSFGGEYISAGKESHWRVSI